MFSSRRLKLCAAGPRRATAICTLGSLAITLIAATAAFAQDPGRGGPPDRGGPDADGGFGGGFGRPAMARLEDEIARLREAVNNAETQIRDLARRVNAPPRLGADRQPGPRAADGPGPRDRGNLDAWGELGRRMEEDRRPDPPRGPSFADRGPRPGRGPQSDFRRGPQRLAGGPPGARGGFRDGERYRDDGSPRGPAFADRPMGPPRGDRFDGGPPNRGGDAMPNVVARLDRIERRLDAIIRQISDERPAPRR